MAPTFQINFDTRTKEVLLDSLGREQALAEDAIRSGDYSREALIRYEEVLRIRPVSYTHLTLPTILLV